MSFPCALAASLSWHARHAARDGSCFHVLVSAWHLVQLRMSCGKMIPPKVSVSDYMGMIKGRTAIRIFKRFANLRQRPYWGNHFWAQGYCVGTVGLDEEKIRKYVKYQEQQERRQEEFRFGN